MTEHIVTMCICQSMLADEPALVEQIAALAKYVKQLQENEKDYVEQIKEMNGRYDQLKWEYDRSVKIACERQKEIEALKNKE